MALNKELWLQTIQEQLFKNDEFINAVGQDHSGYVNNRTVHIPQAGSNPTISKNLTVFPAPVGTRTDADLTYNIDLYYSQPIRVGVDETQYISYDKRASVLSSHLKKMRNVIGNNTLYAWAPTLTSSNHVRTSGSTAATALAPSATGTRKVPKLQDFYDAASILDAQDLNPSDTRYAIVPSAMYWQLLADTNISKYLEWGASAVAPSGKVAQIAGLTLLRRSSVVVYDNTGTPVIKTIGDEGTPSSPAAADNMAILVVSESYVAKAVGNIDIYTEDKSPTYYGDIMSVVVAQGACKMRTNGEGITAIVQAA
jgi:ribosomal protein L14